MRITTKLACIVLALWSGCAPSAMEDEVPAARDPDSARHDGGGDATVDAASSTDAAVVDAMPPVDAAPMDASIDTTIDASHDGSALDDAAGGSSPSDASLDGATDATDAGSCDSPLLGAPLVEHACLHAEYGPFASLSPTTGPSSAPSASRPHTAFELTFLADAPRGFVRFEAISSGLHALFFDVPTDVVVTESPSGLASKPLWQQSSSCAPLAHAVVVELTAGASYRLSLVPIDMPPARLVIEALSPFGDDGLSGACGCSAAGAQCEADADCCTNYCQNGTCSEIEGPSCDGGVALGASCAEDAECCSGVCSEGRCVATLSCRSDGPCTRDDECCIFCHDGDHCH